MYTSNHSDKVKVKASIRRQGPSPLGSGTSSKAVKTALERVKTT